jgi:hypothetical protein
MAYTGSKAQAGRGSKIEIGPAASSTVFPLAFSAASTTSGSPTITMASTPTGVAVGQAITLAGIPAGSTVVSFVPNTSITASANATATASGLTGSLNPAYTSIGEIKKAGVLKASFDKEDVSNFDSGLDKEFAKLMRDNGMPTFSGNRVSSDAGQLAAVAAFNDGDNAYLFRVTIRKRPDQSSTGDVYTFNALVMGLTIGDVETDKTIPWDLQLQISGPVTFVAGS